jgi:Flp pilus assembly protein protease CpaA
MFTEISYAELLAGTVILASVGFDIATRKIPNAVTFLGMTAGIFYTVFFTGDVFLYNLMSMFIIFAFGFFGVMGMGDLKLFMATASFLGIMSTSVVMFFAATLLVLTDFLRHPKKTFAAIQNTVYSFFVPEAVLPGPYFASYPFAPFIFAGFVLRHFSGEVFNV